MIIFLIVLSFVLGLNIRYSLLLCIPLSILFLLFLFFRYKSKIKFLISFIFIGIGVGFSFITINNNLNNKTALIISSKTNYVIAFSNFEKVYISVKNNQYEIGDFVVLQGEKETLNFYTIESEFDFKNYLNKKGVNFEFVPTKITTKFSNPIRLKNYKNSILKSLNKESQSMVKSILFSEIDNGEIQDNLSSLHLSRLLSTSGVYLYGFYSVFVFILQCFCGEKRSKLIGIFLLIPYIIVSFFKFSVLRLFLLLILRFINKYKLNGKYNFFALQGFSALLFLIVDFHLALSTGFILGYLIPIVLYFINVSLRKYKRFKKKILSLILLAIYFIPFEVSFYNQVNLFSYILQPILAPIFIGYGFISSVLLLGVPIYPVVNGFTHLISNLVSNLNFISFGIYIGDINPLIILIYNFLFFALLHYIDIKFKPLVRFNEIGLSFIFVLLCLPLQNTFYNSVTFINVGQGDACLIQKKFTTILIDTGGSLYTDIANDCLIPYFKKRQIYDIDLLITTHDDYDHSGAKDELINNFNVKRYINDYSEFPLTIGEITLTNYNTFINKESDENDRSLVIGFSMNNKNFLITGDASIQIEKEIMKNYSYIPCDVLKVGHHGSDTSTSDDFLSFLSPKEAIISVGRNYYGHPSNKVISSLKKHNIKIHRTDKEGSVTYKMFFLSN